MKSFNHFLILFIFGLVFNYANSRYIKKDDNYYLIFIDNTFGQKNIQKRQEPKEFVTSLVKEIDQLIIENKDTYKDLEELNKFEQNSNSLKKRNQDVDDSSYVNIISNLDDITVLHSYLSYELNGKVKTLDGIRGVEVNREIDLGFGKNIINDLIENIKQKRDIINDDNDINYDINEIKKETGWNDVKVQENAELHLSLVSQSKFNGTYSLQYDTNYYYPSSAGEGIDIFIVDTSFNFKSPEFSNKNERITKCFGILRNGVIEKPESDDYCTTSEYHGEVTSQMAGGLNYGIAKKANIYGIAFDMDSYKDGYMRLSDLMIIFDYICNIMTFKPYKTIFSLSIGELLLYETDEESIIYFETIFNKLNEMNVIVVAAAGNKSIPVVGNIEDYGSYIYLPCALDSVICVGAIDNAGLNAYLANFLQFYDRMSKYASKNVIKEKYYRRAFWSNYGEQVNIYGPGYATYITEEKGYEKEANAGTSFSTPIVAGVIATIMSEHPNIKYNMTSMLSYLYEIGEKDIIEDSRGPNVFINNGKHSLYLRDIDPELISQGLIDEDTELETDFIFDYGYDYGYDCEYSTECVTGYEFYTESVTGYDNEFNTPNTIGYESDESENEIDIKVESEIEVNSDDDSDDDIEL